MEHSNIVNPRYEYYTEKPDRTGVWPACEKADYIRDLNGELIAVKRAGYYAVIYVGKPAPSKHYISGRESFRTVNDGENSGGGFNLRKITPYLGGGLSMFWTPSYGSALLATNWAPTTHNGLIALQADGKRYWEDYFATRYVIDQKAALLTVTGRIENLPIAYTRQYRFAADDIEIHVTLRAEQAVSLTSLTENIPFAEGVMKARGAELSLTGEKDGQAQTDRFTLRDKQNAGVEVLLDGPRTLRIQRNGLRNNDLQIGRVEVLLPAQLAAGQQVELLYHVRPLR
jgi:hypothetical protein